MTTEIDMALYERLATLDTPYPIAWPELGFNPPIHAGEPHSPPDGPHIVVQEFGRGAEVKTIRSHDEHTGTMDISVRWPKGFGTIPAKNAAQDISAHFARGAKFGIDGARVQI